MAKISKTRLGVGIVGTIIATSLYTLINYMDSREPKPNPKPSYSQTSSQTINHPSRLNVSPNDIANLIRKARPNFKQPPWNRYNENGSLTLTNPTLEELSNYLSHYLNLSSAHPELSRSTAMQYLVSGRYNVLKDGSNGPVWSHDPSSEILIINDYDDILKDLTMALPEYMRKYNIKFTDNKITTFHDSTPEEKRRMLYDFIVKLGINLLYGAPDCQDGINPLKKAVKQKRINPAYLHTLGIIWSNKVLGMNKMHYITGITVQEDKKGKIILPFNAIRAGPEGGLDKHLYMVTHKNPSPELQQMLAEHYRTASPTR